ncbi:MAG: 16S rRNA (cytosine(1402)-N(4))-methyltransferase RsmH [Candidatus Staskawiczbacteria bacterium]|jgi:16S rRNA (cytosine1402-N4)-methyltransferase
MHIPVLRKEVLQYLDPKPNENFVDCTIGQAGHTKEILEKIKPSGKVLGIDWDKAMIWNIESEIANQELKNRLTLVNDSYSNLSEIVKKYNFEKISGILLDLGMSSWHIEDSGRGFTFSKDEPLDARYNAAGQELTAMEIINKYPQGEIERILNEYGEERFARKISEKIVQERKRQPISTTFQLIEIVRQAVRQHGKINPATRTFQALRIAVNDELGNLKKTLPQAIDNLQKGGRLAVISFHSLEDRIVKNFFKDAVKEGKIDILTKKPIIPSLEEIKINRRSRSAKLRVAIKN